MPALDFESDQFLQLLTDALRAGPGSPEWHEANDALDAETTGKKGPPTTNVVAIVSAGLLLGAAAVLLYLLFPGGAPMAAIERLSNTYFVEPILEQRFEYSIAKDFDRIGSLGIE